MSQAETKPKQRSLPKLSFNVFTIGKSLIDSPGLHVCMSENVEQKDVRKQSKNQGSTEAVGR